MRLPWPFGQNRSRPETSGPAAPGEWRALSPLSGLLGTPRLIGGGRAFPAWVSVARSLAPVLQRLPQGSLGLLTSTSMWGRPRSPSPAHHGDTRRHALASRRDRRPSIVTSPTPADTVGVLTSDDVRTPSISGPGAVAGLPEPAHDGPSGQGSIQRQPFGPHRVPVITPAAVRTSRAVASATTSTGSQGLTRVSPEQQEAIEAASPPPGRVTVATPGEVPRPDAPDRSAGTDRSHSWSVRIEGATSTVGGHRPGSGDTSVIGLRDGYQTRMRSWTRPAPTSRRVGLGPPIDAAADVAVPPLAGPPQSPAGLSTEAPRAAAPRPRGRVASVQTDRADATAGPPPDQGPDAVLAAADVAVPPLAGPPQSPAGLSTEAPRAAAPRPRGRVASVQTDRADATAGPPPDQGPDAVLAAADVAVPPLAGPPQSPAGLSTEAPRAAAPRPRGRVASVQTDRADATAGPPPDQGPDAGLAPADVAVPPLAGPPQSPAGLSTEAPRAAAPRPRGRVASVQTDRADATAGPPPDRGPAGRVRIERSGDAASVAASLGADAVTAGSTIFLPSTHGSLQHGRARALLAHELVHVEQQRRLGEDLPPGSSSAGMDLERDALRAERSVHRAARLQTPLGPMPRALARPPGRIGRAVHGATTSTAEVATATALAREAGLQAPGNGSVSVELGHRWSEPTGSAALAVTAQRASAPSSPAEAPADEPSEDREDDLEDLARRIYERVGFRLRRELLTDRERAGLLMDPR